MMSIIQVIKLNFIHGKWVCSKAGDIMVTMPGKVSGFVDLRLEEESLDS